MENINNSSELLSEQILHAFYTYAVLPQFGILAKNVKWGNSRALAGDESAHEFVVDESIYVLIFEDHDGLGRNDKFVRHEILPKSQSYEFVEPTSQTSHSPSYDGLRLSAPSHCSPNITGTYTLLKVLPIKQ